MFSKILLSVDGSEHSARAAEKVGEIAESLGSEVLAFNVREMLPVRGGAYDVKLGEEEKDLAAEVASQLKAKGVKATSLRAQEFYGLTPKVIVDAAEKFGADVIVMGSRGRSDLPGLLLGSVTHKVLSMTRVPVLVIR
ncbi:MAG TPA: universal stress protein [Nocardioidaceae bacterium]|jgi:nucleotide-binding universal stress UspA family protein|nr:universal stress protein [Nocardioidaceae bacterium]